MEGGLLSFPGLDDVALVEEVGEEDDVGHAVENERHHVDPRETTVNVVGDSCVQHDQVELDLKKNTEYGIKCAHVYGPSGFHRVGFMCGFLIIYLKIIHDSSHINQLIEEENLAKMGPT